MTNYNSEGDIMGGWLLKNGTFENSDISVEQFLLIIEDFFSKKTKITSSYKYCLFQSLLDNLDKCNTNYCLTFEQVFERVAEIYQDLIFINDIYQIRKTKSNKSKIRFSIETLTNRYGIIKNTKYSLLNPSIKEELVKITTIELSKYVIGAFFVDTKMSIYSFSKKEKTIIFNPKVYYFLKEYKNVIQQLIFKNWFDFLVKVNTKDKLIYTSLSNALKVNSKPDSVKDYV